MSEELLFVLISMFRLFGVQGCISSSLPVLLHPLSIQTSVDESLMVWMDSMDNLGAVLGDLFSVWLFDEKRTKRTKQRCICCQLTPHRILIVTLFLLSTCFLLMPFVKSWLLLLILQLLIGTLNNMLGTGSVICVVGVSWNHRENEKSSSWNCCISGGL